MDKKKRYNKNDTLLIVLNFSLTHKNIFIKYNKDKSLQILIFFFFF